MGEFRKYLVRVARSGDAGISLGVREYTVTLEERMTVLDALFQVQQEHDPSLAFRCACRVGMCGTCAIRINGIPGLACRTRPSQLGSDTVNLEPLSNLPVVKDLAVSMEPFFAQWKRIRPAFRPAGGPSRELARVPADSPFRRLGRDKRDCITCGACFSACGIKASNGDYLGPAALNQAFLRILDPRDGGARERLRVVDEERSGVWRCHTQFNCTAVCPKGIALTDAIARLKRMALRPEAVRR